MKSIYIQLIYIWWAWSTTIKLDPFSSPSLFLLEKQDEEFKQALEFRSFL